MKGYIKATCGLALIANLYAGNTLNEIVTLPGGLKSTFAAREVLYEAIAVNKKKADVKKVGRAYLISGIVDRIAIGSELEDMANHANLNKDDTVTFKEAVKFTNAFYTHILKKRANKKK